MTPAPLTEFEIDGHEYRISKLTAFQQLHVSRKISPLIPPLIPVFMKVSKAGGFKGDLSALPELLQPFADGLSGMQDDAAEYVIGTCLSALKRKHEESGNWTAVWNQSGKVFMFADLNDLSGMIPLVMRVIMDSLGPFIRGLLTNQETEKTQA
jgi:tail assembly chaperone